MDNLANIIMPLGIMAITLTCGFIALKRLKAGKKGSPAGTEEQSARTAQEFINIKDIDEHFLYTNDGLAIVYLRIEGILINLLSKAEQESLVKRLAADFSVISFPFKHISVSRPVDISQTLVYWNELLEETDDDVRKMLLKSEIRQLGNTALSGNIVERQHYVSIWAGQGEAQDLLRNAHAFVELFSQNNIGAYVLGNAEIVRLMNLVHNPNYVHLESSDYEAAIPLLEAFS
ncbi:MAG: hypothetical protein FWG91_03855 [Lachnospiraceae bacterium]|nr:hypothetical protein [Lachnospiraceae bacterium]